MESELDNIEYFLRGKTLSYSSHIETMLSHIIIIANGSNSDWEGTDLKNIQFKNKVKKAIESIQLVDNKLYLDNKLVLEELNHLHFRHRMAHCPFIWDQKDKSFFTVWEFQSSDKDAGAVPVVYTLEQANQELERLAEICEQLKGILSVTVRNFQNQTGIPLL